MGIFTEEHEIFRRSLKRFIEKEIAPYIDEWEEKGHIPRSVWKKFGEQGYLCPYLDEKYGGAGASYEYSVIIYEELSKAGIRMGVPAINEITSLYIYKSASEELKEKWLPGCTSGDVLLALGMTEPNAGSDLQAIKTTAVKDGNEYIINGQKTLISNGMDADAVVVACKTDLKAVPPYKGISLILVECDRPGFTRRNLKKLGLHNLETAVMFFEDCRVPITNLIGEEGMGFYYMMQTLQEERLAMIAIAQSLAEHMLAEAIEYAKSREAFGQPIIKFQHNTFKIVEMATEIELGRTFLNTLVEDYVAGKDVVTKISMAKWWSAEMVNWVAYHCLQLYGGYGYMEEYSIARCYRDARIFPIYGGTTEIMKTIIAKRMGL